MKYCIMVPTIIEGSLPRRTEWVTGPVFDSWEDACAGCSAFDTTGKNSQFRAPIVRAFDEYRWYGLPSTMRFE